MTQQEYFDLRAKRYNQCLSVFPNARAMDVLPYLYVLANQNKLPKTVCDTFGGSGFITNSLSEKLNASFTIADASVGMMDEFNGKDISLMQVKPDFSNFVGKYDMVISHGGLHHAIEMDGNKADRVKSDALQSKIVRKLADSVNPGGLLIVSDIPKVQPEEFNTLSPEWDGIYALMRDSYKPNINFVLDTFKTKNVKNLNAKLHNVMDTVHGPAPKYFFDEYVANNMALGHIASYPDFNMLDQVAKDAGLELIFRMNFCTPWVFDSLTDAGWFMREKFSIGTETQRPGQEKNEDIKMVGQVANYLGLNEMRGKVLTNWGVTYSAWKR